MKSQKNYANSFTLLNPEVTARNTVPGMRAFRCWECGHTWQTETRDCLSPTGETCSHCLEFVQPWMHLKDLVLMAHDRFSVDLCRQHPNKLFVFGDNIQRRGKGGQAIIRDEPNAFGIATKVAPLMSPPAFFQDDINNLDAIEADILKIKIEYIKLWSTYTAIVFPLNGIGTGLARLQETAPMVWDGLNWLLQKHLGYQNGVRP